VAPNWWPFEVIGSEYFQTFGIPVVRGRGLLDIDRQDAPSVAVVSQSVARRLWPGEDPIGKRFRFPPSGCDSTCDQWRTVVGVVPDTRFRALREAWPTLYFAQRQMQDPWQGLLAIRSAEGVATLAPAVRAALHRVDPTLAVFDLKSMDDVVDRSLAEPRLVALLVVAFGIVALILAAVGLYGVIASAVRDRTHEIGVRMALGATPKRIRDSVLRQTLVITCAGAVAGLLGAVTVTRLLRALLFGVSPTDPIPLASACVVLLAAGAVAAYVPARRATRVDPVRALRAE
jgi:putative ABC transport system permease protein